MHGFPDDIHAYDGVALPLAASGCRVIVPYLCGCGPTRFRNPETPLGSAGRTRSRSPPPDRRAQPQGSDPRRLRLGRSGGLRRRGVVAGAGRQACLDQRLQYPEHRHSGRPQAPAAEHRAIGINGTSTRIEVRFQRCRLRDFDNPDFVDVVIQSYRHRYGNAPGAPACDTSEAKLAAQPPISVPTIVLHGEADGVGPAASSESTHGISPARTSAG